MGVWALNGSHCGRVASSPLLEVGGFKGLSHDSQQFRLLGGGHPCLPLTQTPLSPFLLAVTVSPPQ